MNSLFSSFKRLLRPSKIAAGWPKWISETAFETPNFYFETQISDYSKKTTADAIQLLKPKSFLELYDSYIADARNVLEIGFFQGGMPLYVSDMSNAEKIVAIDLNPVPEPISGIISAKGLGHRVRMHGSVNQSDAERVTAIIKEEFNEQSIDLIADDASHLYEPTKKSFETCFSYLKPGGRYIIEDWGWSHWNKGDFLKSHKSFSAEAIPLSQLILEIVLAQCAHGGLIEKIEILNGSLITITRGNALKRGERLDLDSLVNVGRTFSPTLARRLT